MKSLYTIIEANNFEVLNEKIEKDNNSIGWYHYGSAFEYDKQKDFFIYFIKIKVKDITKYEAGYEMQIMSLELLDLLLTKLEYRNTEKESLDFVQELNNDIILELTFCKDNVFD